MTIHSLGGTASSNTEDQQQLRILLVEDNPLQQHLTARLLRQLGHAVTTANDGFEALSVIQQCRIDVVIMDCQMPLMDGFEATRLIKELSVRKNKKIAIIGVSVSEAADDCFKAGMDDFLRKPLNKQILKAILSRWIRDKEEKAQRISSEVTVN
ncbi:MAG: response regulator [Candidatus Melainabacteria bacterium]|nr:response regulator [Candidatus Melainabacteria bacterium]